MFSCQFGCHLRSQMFVIDGYKNSRVQRCAPYASIRWWLCDPNEKAVASA
jgi:hypothetical protein